MKSVYTILQGQPAGARVPLMETKRYLEKSSPFSRYERELKALALECCHHLLDAWDTQELGSVKTNVEEKHVETIYLPDHDEKAIPYRVRLLIQTLHPMARVRLPNLRGLNTHKNRK